MNFYKLHLLKEYQDYNLPNEIIEKIKNDDINVYEAYKIILNYIKYNIIE